jgi:MerR family mercuric resistance operon transcriptional regulator
MLRRSKTIRREGDAHRGSGRANHVRGTDNARTSRIAHTAGSLTDKPLLIGQLAASAGVKADSVRFYERSGLLPKPRRSASGYRVYDRHALDQLRFIKKAQSLGFSLDEVRRILRFKDQGTAKCRSVLAMAEAILTETELKLAELQRFHDTLATNVRRWRKRPAATECAAEFCDLIEESNDKQSGKQ